MNEQNRQGELADLDNLVLVADIGGTHVRFGLADDEGNVVLENTFFCSDYPDVAAAAKDYLAEIKEVPHPSRGVFAIACPVTGDQVEMTNHIWDLSIDDTRRRLGLEQLRMVNDFTALALALPVLGPEATRRVKEGVRRMDAPIALIGPGTGLGVSGLIPIQGTWRPLASEGGHRDLAAANDREWQVVRVLLEQFGRVSAERALSGPGLVNIYRALCRVAGTEPRPASPRDIVERARTDAGSPEMEATQLFSGWLGDLAGDLAITLGARCGVYLAGGVLPKMGALFDEQLFRDRFLDKGRIREYLNSIPVDLIVHPTAALLGAARVLGLED